MFWMVVCMLAVAEAAKLDNAYLPPPAGAKEAGGTDGALQVPLEPPYIDRYTPEAETQAKWRPGTRSLKRGDEDKEQRIDEDEQPDTVPGLEKSRFISGSYSYTGPDNVLVTVTYTAKDQARKLIEEEEESEEEQEEEVEEESRAAEEDEEEEVEEDDSVIPTPPSLPAALARAFDFHKKKYEEHQAAQEKTNKPKKPLRGPFNKRKHGHKKGAAAAPEKDGYGQQPTGNGQQPAGQYGMRIPGHHHGNSGYQHPQHPHQNQLYGTPTIHQGYSYPKPN